MKVIKRDGTTQEFNIQKIRTAIQKAFHASEKDKQIDIDKVSDWVYDQCLQLETDNIENGINIEVIQDLVETGLMRFGYYETAKTYIKYREARNEIRNFAERKKAFINKYKEAYNTADATIDDNSNVAGKNIGILNSEGHKEDNVQTSRSMMLDKLRELYPDFDAKNYIKDLEHHIIYKHDESSFIGAIAPYCCSISMYPFLTDGLRKIGGLSAAPKNLDSFCGMYINLIFAISGQFAGAVATSEFLVYFDYFARKEWGNDYYKYSDETITCGRTKREMTIRKQIHQYFQQVIYSINQPAAARGMQAAFVNFSYFDKPFFDGMFADFVFPDGDKPTWESVKWIQKEFMQWFNEERLRCIITFPVESVSLLYQNEEFVDKEMFEFVCQEYARGHSFFTYISDSVDSLSSCCRLKNMLQTKEFSFTNGNMGIMTGSKSVITLNLNRIVQDWWRKTTPDITDIFKYKETPKTYRESLKQYIIDILERVYKYQTAYNELLWDMYDANLLPVYKAGFIDLNKQYLTIGLNGLNQAAEYLGMTCNDNPEYMEFCQFIFSTVSEQNKLYKTTKTTFNCEQVPAESLAVKNYNWDKSEGYWVPEDTNLYASYVFKPNDESTSVLEKLRMHGRNYIGDYLDGGSAAHINLAEHLSYEQYKKILEYAAKEGVTYFTFNVPNAQCEDCGFITKVPITECPHCHSKNISLYDRIIGYLTKIKNWSDGRRKEQKTRVYAKI